MDKDYRIEYDTLGSIHVSQDKLWGAQTQRAIENFQISDHKMPRSFLRALGLLKAACAHANGQIGSLTKEIASAIELEAMDVAAGLYDDHFPVDVFQTGSGTSTNMNANEVIANLASKRCKQPVHPNDHVNFGQSSNDVIPTAIHMAAVINCQEHVIPALDYLETQIRERARDLKDIVKNGRTHLMDAVPIRFDQELGGWAAQIQRSRESISRTMTDLSFLPIGGTAVGTMLNVPAGMTEEVLRWLNDKTDILWRPSDNRFADLSAPEKMIRLSGSIKSFAVALMKIANDLRWMNSGPLSGLNEIQLPVLQPGSSIMPGKVNPVAAESACQVAAHIIGNDSAITVGGLSGNFQLNVMFPVIAYNLLESLQLAGNSARNLADHAIRGFVVNQRKIEDSLGRNPILVTALNPVIGYENAAKIAKRAYAENRALIDVAQEMTDLSESELKSLLDPKKLTAPL